jgi:PAS domain S-box-containing protein
VETKLNATDAGELEARARRQGWDLDRLIAEAAATAARVLRTESVRVLERAADGGELRVRAAHGEPPPDADEPAAEVLEADGPVVLENALAAPIRVGGAPFAVIEARSRTPRRFSPDEAGFLQSLADVLGAAAERASLDAGAQDSEDRFRELADALPALMWIVDADGQVTFVNEGWLRFTGRTAEELLGDSFGMSAHPDDRDELTAAWQECFERREEFRHEYRLARTDGVHRWVLEVGTPRFADGEFVGYVGLATDIHERRAMEEALRESEASFRELADTAPVMMWTTDTKGLVTFVNAGWLRFTGTRLEEELGDTWTLGVHPDDGPGMLASWERSVNGRTPWEAEYRLRDRWGEYRWIVDRGVPRYEGGRFVGHVGTAIDIHQRKTMEAQLEESYLREHRIAETLQRSLLPERLPRLEGLELAARYLPAVRGAAIGGDWYDALERPDGRVALVVGDVVGHGLRAAATMGQLRNAFRAYGLVESSPSAVVASINRLVMSGPEEVMATVLYLVLDRETGEVTFTSAGHPPPLVLEPGGPRFLESGRSVPVGAADPTAFREGADVLAPGSTLVLYTDGLVERRGVALESRLDQLARTAGEAEPALERLCEAVLYGLLADQDPEDDVALLVVRPELTDSDRIALSLPAEPESLVGLRRRLGRFLHGAGASEPEVFEIMLSVCEAAGNAIEHAYGPADASFQVEVTTDGGEVVASVQDEGAWRERRGEHRGRGLKIMNGLMDAVDVDHSDGGTVVTMRRRLTAHRPW